MPRRISWKKREPNIGRHSMREVNQIIVKKGRKEMCAREAKGRSSG